MLRVGFMIKELRMVIADDSCNGEELKFEAWMNEKYPDIETVVEPSLSAGLYDLNDESGENLDSNDKYWNEYCSQ